MANTKITDLTAYTDAASTDVLPIVDVSNDVTKKISISNLLKAVPAGTAAAPGISFDGDNSGIYSPGADQVAISTNGTGRLFVDASGNVGVGTSPSHRLHISGTGSVSSRTFATDATGDASFYVQNDGNGLCGPLVYGSTKTAYGALGSNETAFYSNRSTTILADGASAVIKFASGGNTERMRLDSSGRLGLGTSAPGTILDARGIVSIGSANNSNAIIQKSAVPIGSFNLTITSGGGLTSESASTPTDALAGSVIKLLGGDPTTDTFGGGIQYYANGSTSPNGAGVGNQHVFYTRSAVNTYTERLRIDAAGRVGIGTQTPGGTLNVQSSASDTWASASDGLVVNGGNVSSAISTITTYYDDSSIRIGAGVTQKTGLLITGNTSGSGSTIQLRTGNSERARIDSSGRLLVGTFAGGSYASRLVVQGHSDDAADNGILHIARGSTTPANGNNLGAIKFSDSSKRPAAEIYSARDGGTWTSESSQPTRLVLATTADGASSPTERVRVTSGGYFKASNSGTYYGSTALTHELRQTQNDRTLVVTATDANYSNYQVALNVDRAATTAYAFLECLSGNFADREFNLRGDGNAFADGSWTGGGADYAEYFEWSDGNPNEDDRRGIAVVLDGDKIRPAVAGEDPIGVISGNPSVVGDAAWNKWSGKYLRDEYGTYILEDYEVEDEDGNTVIQQRRKLNPAYDPDAEYISREQRPEWDCVGLMGKLRLRKGQPTGSRWIKMRDISANVEEWLVR